MTSASAEATGRQTERVQAISGGLLTKLSSASPPLKPSACRVANTSSHCTAPAPGAPRWESARAR